ncbi:MAG: hypothetical protein IPK26_20745 [Planctomycetes bacterium]|nr:hypothetical protein [Planctomycetota bacterium]
MAAGKEPRFDYQVAKADRPRVDDAWRVTAQKLADLHREFGLQMLPRDALVRGMHDLEQALFFDPEDRVAHERLGHQEFAGIHGSEEQIAFVRRAQAIRAGAAEIAKIRFEVAPIRHHARPAALAAPDVHTHHRPAPNDPDPTWLAAAAG